MRLNSDLQPQFGDVYTGSAMNMGPVREVSEYATSQKKSSVKNAFLFSENMSQIVY